MANGIEQVSNGLQGQSEQEITRAQERHVRPPVDIYETGEALVLIADLPGVTKETLQVRVDDELLTIEAKATERAPGNLVYREFELTNFFRQFALVEELDTEQVKADLRYGVLTLYLPKSESAKPKQISVAVSQ
jgi:HSP20 family protein